MLWTDRWPTSANVAKERMIWSEQARTRKSWQTIMIPSSFFSWDEGYNAEQRKRQEKERKERKRENLTPAVATRANYRVFVAIRGHEHYKTSPMPWSLISDKVFRLASLCDLHHRGGIPCAAKANKGRKRRAKANPRQRRQLLERQLQRQSMPKWGGGAAAQGARPTGDRPPRRWRKRRLCF